MLDEAIVQEYFKLVDIVNEFDQRLLTIKGWGVTLSLAALGLGFQYQHYGFFLVAAVSGLMFWIIEYTVKRHQMRYYVRMNEIEVYTFTAQKNNGAELASPLIDWSWRQAGAILTGQPNAREEQPTLRGKSNSYIYAWLWPHVSLPHVVTLAIGTLFFALGLSGALNMPI